MTMINRSAPEAPPSIALTRTEIELLDRLVQLDCHASWVGGVEQLEEFDEFAAAMPTLDQRMDFAGDEIDASQQADVIAMVIVVRPRSLPMQW